MIDRFLTFAQRSRDDAINSWLDENPLVLGLIALALGGVILGWGLYELKTGVARDKRGRRHEGTTAKGLAIVRIVFGSLACLFGLYKIVAG